jgi:hypothetical protein
VISEEVEAADAAGGVHLGDLCARQPAKDVEVVDVEIPEDTAGARDVFLGRGFGVVGGEPQRVDGTEGAGIYQALRLCVSGVEASLEADLERRVGGLDRVDDLDRVLVAERDRFLAESRYAGLNRGEDQGRVRRSGGGDNHGVGPRTEHVLYLPGLSSDLRGYHLGPLRVGVPDEYPVNAWVAGQQAGVEGADTASPE